jgi:Glycosyltransferases involved in cell wall biogenesis
VHEPLVSIVIPTYQGATRGFLPQAIESVLSQTYKNLELILVNDGSSDATEEVCKRYPQIKYIFQENRGLAAARNTGIRHSFGEYICFLDDDDVWLPEKLAKQVAFIQDKPLLGLCYTWLALINERGEETGVVQAHHAEGNVFELLLTENIIDGPSSVIIPKTILDDVGLFKEHFLSAEDYDLWLRIAKKYHIYSLDEPLVLYRVHAQQMSKKLDEVDRWSLQAVFEAIGSGIDRNKVLCQFYKKRAAHRFWLGDFKTFRRYMTCASAYGPRGLGEWVRVVASYMPGVVKLFRRFKLYVEKFKF